MYLRLSWTDSGQLSCTLSDWAGPLDERLLAAAEAIAAAIDKIDAPEGGKLKMIEAAIGTAH